MKKIALSFLIVIMLFTLCGCLAFGEFIEEAVWDIAKEIENKNTADMEAFPKPDENTLESEDIVYFAYTHSGMSIDEFYSYSVTADGENYKMYNEFDYGQLCCQGEFPKDESDKLREIIKKYELIEWYGYKEENEYACDGSSFSLAIKFSDGSAVEAFGNNSFPKNYYEASTEINELFEELAGKYGEYSQLQEYEEDNEELLVNE